jgi:hypothetical protein
MSEPEPEAANENDNWPESDFFEGTSFVELVKT